MRHRHTSPHDLHPLANEICDLVAFRTADSQETADLTEAASGSLRRAARATAGDRAVPAALTPGILTRILRLE
jgi:hypothetical protein